MRPKYVALIVGGIALLIGSVLLVTWIADTTPIHTHTVENDGNVLYVRLLRSRAIVNVSITPFPERVHLDVHYDGGVTRHVHVETNGRTVLISPVRIMVTSISKDFFTDRLETWWFWKGGTLLPHHGQTLYGAIGYVPATNTCTFLEQENDDGPLQGWWEREQ